MSELEKYIEMLSSLHVAKIKGHQAPHKAILLLAIFDFIKNGEITENKILLTDNVATRFQRFWNLYVENKIEFSCFNSAPWTPFWHLRTEPFWHFKARNTGINIDTIVPPGQTASIGKMKENIEYAYFDENLYSLLKDPASRDKLANVLFKNYINI